MLHRVAVWIMECSRSFAIATINLYYFVFIGLSFGDTNKRREQPYSSVLLLYPLRPSLTAGVLEVGLNNADNMTDQRQPCEQRSSCEGSMLSSSWLSTSTAGDIDVGLNICDSYPGGAHPGDDNH